MSIVVTCEVCKKELDEPGAIMLSPPLGKCVDKMHICVSCYGKLPDMIDQIDMYRDEFKRIQCCPGVTDEIIGICNRALTNIHRRIPVIDELEKANEIINNLTISKARVQEHSYDRGKAIDHIIEVYDTDDDDVAMANVINKARKLGTV